MKFELASFFKRLIAFLLDFLPILFVVVTIAITNFGYLQTIQDLEKEPENFSALKDYQVENYILLTICLAIWIIYGMIMDASERQGTYGKQLLKIKVVNEKGERLTFEESFKRNVTKTISWNTFQLGFFWMLFDSKKQTWHDKIAGALVVENRIIE